MTAYTLSNDQNTVAFDRTFPPALEIEPGDTVTFETGDVAYERLSKGESVEDIDLENFNRVTGPVAVARSRAGRRARDRDHRCPGDPCLVVSGCPSSVASGIARPRCASWRRPCATAVRHIGTLSVPVRPMIGCIGVAPAEGVGSTFMPAYPFGGNMDLREMEPGTTVFLPVQVAGGLLSMGDLHAAMGTQEPTWVSLEAAGSATLRIGLGEGHASQRSRASAATARRTSSGWRAPTRRHTSSPSTRRTTTSWPTAAWSRSRHTRYVSASVDMRLGGPATTIVMAVVPDLGVEL